MLGQIYSIKCITNLHVGSGDTNFGVIDNEVQKDPVTQFPCMYSSSVKGAFRDYFEEQDYQEIEKIFGSDAKRSNSNSDNSKKGLLKFMQANLLFLPVRSIQGHYVYYYATCKQALEDFVRFLLMVNKEKYEKLDSLVKQIDNTKCYTEDSQKDVKVNHEKYQLENNSELINTLANLFDINKKQIIIIPDKDFNKLTLPVMARNNLTVQNLFYEEVVPHEAIFYFSVLSTGSQTADDALNSFVNSVGDAAFVQFGGNASIGYGLCDVRKL